MIDPDIQFFEFNRNRQARVRFPDPYNELHREFHELGDHPTHRRRVLVWKVPPSNPFYDPKKPPLLKIPFLAMAHEVIKDDEETALGLVHTIMGEAQAVGGR